MRKNFRYEKNLVGSVPVRIGKQDNAVTAIATSDADSITVRGYDLCDELIGGVDFVEHFWLLVTGERPTAPRKTVTNACLVSLAEHGLVPSVQAARMTLAAAPEAWQGAMAAGLLGMGTVVAGSSEVAGRYLADLAGEAAESSEDLATVCRNSLEAMRAAKRKVPGLGHPQHSGGDPRAHRLIAIADEAGIAGTHVAILKTLDAQATDLFKRPLPMNVSGAIPAVMLDAGWPLEAMKGIPMLARCAGLVAHLFEETRRPIGFIMSHHADQAISYDGRPSSVATRKAG